MRFSAFFCVVLTTTFHLVTSIISVEDANTNITVGISSEETSMEEYTTLDTVQLSSSSSLTTTTTVASTSSTTTTEKSKTVDSLKNPVKYFNKMTPKKRKIETTILMVDEPTAEWKCPDIVNSRVLECNCAMPHTLRCSGNLHGLSVLAESLRKSPYKVSLLDCTLRNVTFLSDARIFENVSLHGLVISSGEIKRIHKSALLGISAPLQALGFPSNALVSVPWSTLAPLTSLERLDLSNNKIKALGPGDFVSLRNLIYMDLSENQISSISERAFQNLKRMEVLKLNGNRLGDYVSSLKSLSQCFNLRQLDLEGNSLNGPLTTGTLPNMSSLTSLNLNKNLIKSIQNRALQNFTKLTSLSLQHNQIDILQDHAFYGLATLELLDLSYNGIVALSSASLQHLYRLKTLDLTHNFLRALTSDLIRPLPSITDLRLTGNDISIIAKDAMDGAKEIQKLSLQENPLSCDCSIKNFAEWLQNSNIDSFDLLSITCMTPPRLEGAPLFQVPLENLKCEMDNIEFDNANILEQLDAISKENDTHNILDLSEKIILKDLHYSIDYGLMLTWILNLNQDDYMCNAIFVYKEENINEILLDHSPVHCESNIINDQNIVSVIVPNSSYLSIGESYRFCIVLVQEHNANSDLVVGCSNITKLELSKENTWGKKFTRHFSDIASFDKVSRKSEEEDENDSAEEDNVVDQNDISSTKKIYLAGRGITSHNERNETYEQMLVKLNESFLPGLGVGVLVTSVLVLIWGAMKIRSTKPTVAPTSTTCYTANGSRLDSQLSDVENGNRYLKLQATTSL